MATESNGRGAIINIDQLLAPDITFVIGKDRWTIAGNISARAAFTIQKLMNDLFDAMNGGEVDKSIEAFEALHGFLLPLFQYKRPGLKELPWEAPTILRVTSIILARALGADPKDLAAANAEENPTTPRTRRPSPNRSTRRAGSARS